jgi:hypothetical protein
MNTSETNRGNREDVVRELTAAELEEVTGAFISNAFNTTIKAIGDGLSAMARKG